MTDLTADNIRSAIFFLSHDPHADGVVDDMRRAFAPIEAAGIDLVLDHPAVWDPFRESIEVIELGLDVARHCGWRP